MQRFRFGLLIGVFVAITLGAVACGGDSSGGDAAADAEWTWLTEAKQSLDSKRQELAELRAQAAEVAVEEDEEGEAEPSEAETTEATEGEGGAVEEVDIEARIETLQTEIEAASDEFTQRLVQYLNSDSMAMIEGEPPTQRQIDALRLKSSEDMILAKEWIDKGGDYKRAIEIYNTALIYDPDNPELQAALAEAEANRWMTEERFAAVENGMTQADIRSLLGQANLHNIRKYEDRGVEAWFYPTAEDGSAAAVWFEPDKKSGELTVYQSKFEAVDPTQLQEAEG